MAVEYRGDEFIYLVEVPGESGDPMQKLRPFNQTGGSTSSEADSIDLSTKDKTGSDYGNVTQSVSLEGVLTENDTAIAHVKKAQRQKQFVRITELNTRTLEAETGSYMISSFERSFSNGEFATYTLEASLNGSISEETLDEVPEGAPDSDAGTGNGGVEG